jgi:gliding motility-associated-like protein
MNNTGAGNYSYSWFGSSDLDNKLENLAKGFYNVTVTDANSCELRLTNIEITECPLPGDCFVASTIITPNGDNFNDTFIINCAKDNSSDLSVFDRWGRLIYSQINYDNTWQGIDNDGKDLKEGAYIWVLTVNFGQGRREVYKGTVTVLRAN